jgi:MerR family mercuric resistance operon transcriptional regulator
MVQSQEPRLKIGGVAKRAGVSIDTVRYYERRGLLTPAERLPSGYRLYSQAAVATIALARRLQSLGMTLDEVGDALRAHDRGEAACESERWRLAAALDRTRARLAELTALRENIETVLARCEAGHCELRSTPPPGPHPARP